MDPEEHKVLGVHWNLGDDRLLFDVSAITQLASTLEPTKRNFISIIFGPIRILDPSDYLVQGLLPETVSAR